MKRIIHSISVTIALSIMLLNCDDNNDLDLNIVVTKVDPTCQICNDGSIQLTISGGKSPYSVSWSNGAVTEKLDSLSVGTYTYTVKDDKNQEVTGNVVLNFYHELVAIETDFGNILIWLYDQTPLHKANFLKLTKDGFYDGLIFHRVIDEFMIQGGDPDGTGSGGPGYKIDAEITGSIIHDLGAVGAARDNNPQKQSNGSQFYIVENKNGAHHLDGNYTVFGIVVDGIDAVHAIGSVPTNAADRPLNDVVMKSVKIESYTAGELKTQFDFIIP